MSVATVGRKVVKFKNNLHEEFNKTLNQRVNQYFKNTKYGRYANVEMVTKKSKSRFVAFLKGGWKIPVCEVITPP